MLALPTPDGVRALVVDDEPDARDLLGRILEDKGTSVTAVASADEALAAEATSKPSVIISDIGMPGMDGFQMIRSFRASEPRESRLPALALTAFAMEAPSHSSPRSARCAETCGKSFFSP
jgi:CheY-like chemotaxis protein